MDTLLMPSMISKSSLETTDFRAGSALWLRMAYEQGGMCEQMMCIFVA